MLTFFDPPPATAALPDRFPSPFGGAPHPLARRAAGELAAELRRAGIELAGPGDGKMFGVLVVADGPRIGYLRAFSGMLGGRWQVDGFAPPLFDEAARDVFWPAGEAELRVLAAELDELAAAEAPVRDELAVLDARHAAEAAELRDRHRANRDHRRGARAAGADAHALDQQSRGDTAEHRRLRAAHDAARAPLAAHLHALAGERAGLDGVRAGRSRGYLRAIHDTYAIASARGARRGLRELFAPDEPPGGAGDCAAPKLLGLAYRERLRPIALAELWWGAPPITGGRHAGVFYPACRGKCGPILAHMLDGLDPEPPPLFGVPAVGDDEPRVVFEDRWLAIVDKPCGLLSVPGRSGALRDSVETRLRARYPGASVVHRLDLDTSGLLLVAKDRETHTALQAMFARREIDKRYLAWLDGTLAAERGTIELPLRVDLDDRPRQIYDPVHGKPALTEWRTLAEAAGRTRVELIPRTGRTHQLRVHAAHPLGLAVPIVGDRLYGRPAERLLLHARSLAFRHPRTGEPVEIAAAAPF